MTVAATTTTGVTKTVPEQPVTPEKPTTRPVEAQSTGATEKKEVASPVTEKKEVASPVTEKKEVASPVTEKKEVASPATEKAEVPDVPEAAALNPSKRYRRVQRNREEKDPKALAHEVRITVSGGVGLFVKEGVRKLLDTTEGIPEIKVMARGPAIAKAVIVSEMINRMIADLEQDVELGSTDVNDEYVSVDEEHETVVATRIVPFLVVTIRHPKGLIDKSTVSRRPRNTRVPIATKADIAAIKEKEEKAKEDTEGASKRKNRRNRRARRGSPKADVADEPTKTEQQVTKPVAEVALETPKKVEKPEEKEAAAPAKPEVAKTAAVETEKEPSAFDGAVKPRANLHQRRYKMPSPLMLFCLAGLRIGEALNTADEKEKKHDYDIDHLHFDTEEEEDLFYGRHGIDFDSDDDDDEDFYHDWEQHFEDFHPSMMMTFTLKGSTAQEFTQDVEVAGQLLRGVLLSNSLAGDSADVDFEIRDPEGNIFFEKRDAAEAMFHERTKLAGEYGLLVTNKHWSDSQEVTLGVMVGGSKTLKTEHITDVQEQIDVLDTILRDTQAESTYLWIRQKNHLGVVQSMHSRVLWFFLFDFVALTVAAWFQVYYVKSLLMDRRFI
ncbi:hypothetical protein FOZ61_005197 [Perkinsus olseni]|uniref:GOLD domain-containing protein n=3 Tax=Perkinsus olseni TaxID=32597 RepID=A0A7J6LWE2_PEROL|nr:hypothetical protein FOZ61_005197 [Perkinsus olseni]KAF4663544.1 hypothetical protein FOL46_004698 [Perkinsus olseni]